MKKFVVSVLALIMLLSIAVIANADANRVQFTFNTPTQAIADDQLYRYFENNLSEAATKKAASKSVHVAHHVTQIDADETNRIAAYDYTTGNTMGAHWHPSDDRWYPCMSNAITQGHKYTAAGRGNTNYASKYGLNTITLTGYLDPDQD